MKWFFVSSFSINVLNVAILLTFMIFFLLKIEKKSKATHFLILFLVGVELVFISFFIIFSSLNPFYTTLAWWTLHLMVFASIAMVQFSYHFPVNLHPRESKVVLALCIILACAAYPYYIYKTLAVQPVFRFDAYAFVFAKRPEIGIVIGAEIIWMLIVFFRKAAVLSEYRYTGLMSRWCAAGRGIFSMHCLAARFVVACIKIFKAQDRRAKAIRNLMLIFISPLVLISVIILAYLGLMSWEIVAHILGSGFMVIAFVFIVVYINNTSEPSTFMVKLVGISLGALLMAIGLGASFAIMIKDSAYENTHLLEVRHYMNEVAQKDLSDLPEDVAYVLAGSIERKSPDPFYEKLYAKRPEFVTPKMNRKGKLELIARYPQMSVTRRQYRQIDVLDPKTYYIHYDFNFGDKIYELGFDYLAYREDLHETGLILIYIVFGFAVFVIVVFPYFFQESLVKPLGVLLDGVKKVNEGDLKVEVPVKVEDEVGYLSDSFNRMVRSILSAREELKGALDHQVKLTESYSCFVPKEFLQFLEKESIVDIKLGDNIQKEMTILFSDIRSFTRLSEQMTPQENFNFINNCLSRIGPVVREHNGFIDKYIGDAVMALFPYNAADAVQSAIGMQRVVALYNNHREKSGYEPIRIGVGVNTGVMMLGTIGEEKRMEGTVISDAVNLTSRLEGLTKIYGSSVIISKKTLSGLERPSDFNYRFLDKVQVKGKQEWVEIYEVFDSDPADLIALKKETKADFEKGITFFQNHKFDDALELFNKVLNNNPNDPAAGLYIKRCRRIQKYGPPEGWDGVEIIDRK